MLSDDGPGQHANIFTAAAVLRHELVTEIRGERYPISPVATGYLAMMPTRACDDFSVVLHSLAAGRTVVLTGDQDRLAATAAATTGAIRLSIGELERADLEFLVPPRYLSRRIQEIAGRVVRCGRAGSAEVQEIRAIGVAALPRSTAFADAADLAHALVGATHVVMSEWTYRRTWLQLANPPAAIVHTVPYTYRDFDRNILAVDKVLRQLQATGVLHVVLLVEGNPDTYDVLDGLSLDRRTITVVPGVPNGLRAALDLSPLFPAHPLRRYAYLSGLPSRHQQSRMDLLSELSCCLAAGVTCILVEMVAGDLEVVLDVARMFGRPCTVAMMSDFYTDRATARILMNGTEPAPESATLDRGEVATVLVAPYPADMHRNPLGGAGYVPRLLDLTRRSTNLTKHS
jgi:hypothetical protein